MIRLPLPRVTHSVRGATHFNFSWRTKDPSKSFFHSARGRDDLADGTEKTISTAMTLALHARNLRAAIPSIPFASAWRRHGCFSISAIESPMGLWSSLALCLSSFLLVVSKLDFSHLHPFGNVSSCKKFREKHTNNRRKKP